MLTLFHKSIKNEQNKSNTFHHNKYDDPNF